RLGFALALCAALPAQDCWEDAASRYQVSSALLYAIARTESGLNPKAIGRNTNGSRDIGLMQINSAWLPTLASHGIGARDLCEPRPASQLLRYGASLPHRRTCRRVTGPFERDADAPNSCPAQSLRLSSSQSLEIYAMSKARSHAVLGTTLAFVLTLAAGSALAG